jgi:hypothetical protein
MRNHPATLEEDLDRGFRETHIERLVDQLVGSAVVVVIHFDMVIDIDLSGFPVDIEVRVNGERFERGPI